MTDPSHVEEVVVVDKDEIEVVKAIAASQGVEVEELQLRAIEPITATLLLLGGSLAVAAVVHLIEVRKGGQVIDLRPGTSKSIYRTKDLAYGLVSIISATGSISVEVKEPRGMFGIVVEQLAKIPIEIGTAGAEALAKAATDAVGDAAVVKELPTTSGG